MRVEYDNARIHFYCLESPRELSRMDLQVEPRWLGVKACLGISGALEW